MTEIHYAGEPFHLVDPAGAHLCVAIRRLINHGHTFWVDLGGALGAEDTEHLLLFGPNIPCDLRSGPLTPDTLRQDVVDVAVRFARARARTIPYQVLTLEPEMFTDVVSRFEADVLPPLEDEDGERAESHAAE